MCETHSDRNQCAPDPNEYTTIGSRAYTDAIYHTSVLQCLLKVAKTYFSFPVHSRETRPFA